MHLTLIRANWILMPSTRAGCCCCCYCCCRTGQFPLDWLQQQLAAPNSIDNTIYNNLQQLLAFLHLPSRVLQWLPVKEMTMQHVLPLRFFHKAAAIQAVEDMLSFRPLLGGAEFMSSRFAAFLVTTTIVADVPLCVHVLKFGDPEAVASLLPKASSSCLAAADSALPEQSCKIGWWMTLGAGSNSPQSVSSSEWERKPLDDPCTAYAIECHSVTPKHEGFGIPLQHVLQETASRLGLHACRAKVTVPTSHGSFYPGIWVLRW